VRRSGEDAFGLTIDYLKQEALEPLKGLGRFLAWGVAGSLAIAVGILLLLVGILRLLQTETGTALTGDWSWVPYFSVSALGVGAAVVAVWRITAGPGRRKLPRTSEADTKEGSS
jgi:predicted cobalt transporter CbtA